MDSKGLRRIPTSKQRKNSNKAANTVGKEAGTLDTGGWCLAVRANAANVARRRKDLEFMEVSLANGQSYTLPKPHVAADKPIVAANPEQEQVAEQYPA